MIDDEAIMSKKAWEKITKISSYKLDHQSIILDIRRKQIKKDKIEKTQDR